MHVHARASPIVMRLGHERSVELVRPRRRLDRALQEQTVERRADRIWTMLEVDLELAGTRLLHDRIDRQTLNLTNPVDVIDERRQRVHLLKAERVRPLRVIGDAVGLLHAEIAVEALFRHIELELDGGDGGLARARELRHLIGEHRAWIELILDVDRHDRLRVPAVADRNRDQRLAENVAEVVMVAGLPQPAGLLDAIAERIHDEDRARHHEPAFGDAEQVGAPHALAARECRSCRTRTRRSTAPRGWRRGRLAPRRR